MRPWVCDWQAWLRAVILLFTENKRVWGGKFDLEKVGMRAHSIDRLALIPIRQFAISKVANI